MTALAAIALYFASAKKHLPLKRTWIRRSLRVIAILVFLGSTLAFFPQLALFWTLNNAYSPSQKEVITQYRQDTAIDCSTDCLRSAIASANLEAPAIFPASLHNATDAEIETFHQESLATWALVIDKDLETVINESAATSQQEIVLGNSSTLEESSTSPSYSVIQWIQGALTDLGISFGWAAFYFSVLPVLWRGQTIGKRLVNIRVLALSGNYLNLWDSFGRYGGYTAGFATGLLGFMQILWDPNRQAIQDKISSTVVIHGSLNKT